jgi:hypothetical protein
MGSPVRLIAEQRKLVPLCRSKMAKFVPLRGCASVGADFGTILTARADAPRYALLGANEKYIPRSHRAPPSEYKVGTPRFDFENVIRLGASGA